MTVQVAPGHEYEKIPRNPKGFYYSDEYYVFIEDHTGGRAKFITVAKTSVESIVIEID